MKTGNKLFERYNEIKSTLNSQNIKTSEYKLIEYGLQFSIVDRDWSGILRVYQNMKGALRVDYSLLGLNAANIQGIIEGAGALPPKQGNKSGANPDEHDLHSFPIIGTDESGKGDYFGPLVSAGVYVDANTAKELAAFGVKDSKTLSDKQNIEIAKQIERICRGRFAIIEVSPERYNDLYEQFKKEKKNLNTLLAWGHAKAIEAILANVECKVAVADKFADERFILSKLQERGKGIKLIQMHKAEQNIAVAAASIIARARFLEKLSRLSNEFKIELPKGSSSPKVVENAKRFVALYGMDKLRKVVKLHFKTTLEVAEAN